MTRRRRWPWLPLLLRRLCWLAAAALAGLVLAAPLLNKGSERPGAGWHRVVVLFASDRTVRRTVLASAVGLAVTGQIFFKPNRSPLDRFDSPRVPPPNQVVGA